MGDVERRRGEGNRGDVDDQHRAGTKVRAEGIPRQHRPGTSADLLADPGLDGRLRRQWLAQKIAAWTVTPPAGFVNPRPAPTGGPRWIPPSLACDRAELAPPADDVAELVACGRSGR